MPELTPGQLADVLESGKYPKGVGALCDADFYYKLEGLEDVPKIRNVNGYCCLGVYAKEVYGFEDEKLVGLEWLTDVGDLPTWMSKAEQKILADLNDKGIEDRWAPVIRRLRQLDAEV